MLRKGKARLFGAVRCGAMRLTGRAPSIDDDCLYQTIAVVLYVLVHVLDGKLSGVLSTRMVLHEGYSDTLMKLISSGRVIELMARLCPTLFCTHGFFFTGFG